MYEDRIQNYDPEFHEEYMIHPTSCHSSDFTSFRPYSVAGL